jgi:hypothetical protein
MRKGTDIRTGPPAFEWKDPTTLFDDMDDATLRKFLGLKTMPELVKENGPVTEVISRGKAPTQRLADTWDPELELVEENGPVTEVISRGKAPSQRLVDTRDPELSRLEPWHDQLTNREKKELGVRGRDADGYS